VDRQVPKQLQAMVPWMVRSNWLRNRLLIVLCTIVEWLQLLFGFHNLVWHSVVLMKLGTFGSYMVVEWVLMFESVTQTQVILMD